MNQCVPNGDPKLSFFGPSNSKSSNSFTTDHVPSLDYEVAELTWENGHLAAYGLGTPRVLNKHAAPPSAWEKPRATDTLESIVDQATALPHTKSDANNKLVPWLNSSRSRSRSGAVSAAASAAMDALVPCNNSIGMNDDNRENSTRVPGMGTCMVGSCSGAAPAGGGGCWARGGRSCASASQSLSQSGGREDSQQMTLDSCERAFGGGGGITSTSMWSPENTSSGEDYSKTSGDDKDVVCRSRSQREAAAAAAAGDRGNRKLGIDGKSSIIAKTRAAAVHNQSERRRRDKINQRMKTLQKLVPNSSKTDKASMLDEVIEYLKQLQAQVQMSRMSMPLASMNMTMMPLPMQQHLQMSMMASMGIMGMGGMGSLMDINSIARATGIPPMMPSPAAAFMPMAPPWDVQHPPLTPPHFLSNFFASQSQPQPQLTTMDGYSRLAALYQQFHQSSAGSGPKN